MRSALLLVLLFSALALLGVGAPAQICAPVPPPSGQPAVMPFTPICIGAVPPPVVWAVGNPGFALAALAPPPVPPGLPMFLVLGLPSPPLPVPLPLLFPPLGFPGFLSQLPTVVVPAGLSAPVPGPMPLSSFRQPDGTRR